MADTIVNVSTAKGQWSRLLARGERGERIVISGAGRLVAELAPVAPRRRLRAPGMDRVVIHDDFDGPLPEFEEFS